MEESIYVPTGHRPISTGPRTQPQSAEQQQSFQTIPDQLSRSRPTQDIQHTTREQPEEQEDPYQIITDLTMRLNHLQLQKEQWKTGGYRAQEEQAHPQQDNQALHSVKRENPTKHLSFTRHTYPDEPPRIQKKNKGTRCDLSISNAPAVQRDPTHP